MKITYKSDYAFKALFQLALTYNKEGEESFLSINDIAVMGDMPTNFLEQILLALRKGGFVKSRRGINGGFYLARSPREITVGSVLRFVEGPIGPIACIEHDNYKGCKDIGCCIFRDVWKELNNAVSGVVDNLTFADLLVRHNERQSQTAFAGQYSI